ncbi:MAG: sulfite exporter TauE/SafE family protein [Ignavibacteria bacterium]
METSTFFLLLTAASLGIMHTALGPDHYVPFIALSRARNWSLKKTALITILCGVFHVLSSIIIGLIGFAFGIALEHLETVESTRGEIATWLLIGFGLFYFIWGLKTAFSHNHSHLHSIVDNHNHSHHHSLFDKVIHFLKIKNQSTVWILFIIFIFGPCEVLIPLFMYSASQHNFTTATLVAVVFGMFTISTMVVIVSLSIKGLSLIKIKTIEKYSHAIAGFTIFICGISIKLFGL